MDEDKIEIILWDWLKTKGQNILKIYFNRKNKLNAPTFKTKGINKKPDFLIKIDRGFGIEFIAVEIKDNTKSKNILDSGKILDIYYENFINKKTKYFIDNKQIRINHFVIATQSSPLGFLFKKEKIKIAKESQNKSKKYVASIGLIPQSEGDLSHQFIRNLWSRHNRIKLKEIKPSIVILIGIEPSIFIKIFVDWLKDKKPKWGQRFWQI